MRQVICEICQKKIDVMHIYTFGDLTITCDSKILLQIDEDKRDLDFCSLTCLQRFLHAEIEQLKKKEELIIHFKEEKENEQ